MNLRQKERIDYQVFDREGRKVRKSPATMEDLKQLCVDELKILDSLNFHLALHALDDLLTVEECKGAIGTITDIYNSYRSVHVELKNALREGYEEKYPNFKTVDEKVTTYLKNVRLKIRTQSGANQQSKNDEEIRILKVEFEFLKKKLYQYNRSIDANVSIVRDDGMIDKYVAKMEDFVSEFFSLGTRMKCICPADFDKTFGPDLDSAVHEVQQDIILATTLKHEIQRFHNDSVRAQNAQNARLKQLTNAENLKSEISIRFKSVSKKLDVKLDDLGDYQVLELAQDKSVDQEFNNLLEKVTELASLADTGNPDVLKLSKIVNKTLGRIATKKDNFFASLQKIVLDRDITTEKLKNASDLVVDLPKFSGYGAEMDFFTFRTKFRKLIEDRVQKKYWADYLKHNYLTGQALLLVEKEIDYEKMWERLSDSYGNARILLQKKLSEIDKIGGLSNVKGNDKMNNALASLINCMKDLSVLASEHDLEGQLYEGGGLEKILFLIGDPRHKKFRTQNIGHVGTKKQEWQKLRAFLEQELLLLQTLQLDRQTALSLGLTIDTKKPPPNPKGGSAHNNLVGKLCHVCDQPGHTTITTARGNIILPYYVCEVFVKMSPVERLSKLTSKNLCTVCLYPGAVQGPSHKCYYTNFCCPSHDKSNRIHVLLCELHKKEDRNIKLLEKFKTRFLQNCPIKLPNFVNSLALFSCTVTISKSEPSAITTVGKYTGIPDITDPVIFKLQTIVISGIDDEGNEFTETFNIFYDNGASDCIIRTSAVHRLLKLGRAELVSSDPIQLRGVNDRLTICRDGYYRIILPLHDGEGAIISGLCLSKITSDFPEFALDNVVSDLRDECQEIGGQELVSTIPCFPKSAGGSTDILLGSRYLRYFPKQVHEFENGLGIFRSVFLGVDGARGVLNGPHKGFSQSIGGTHHFSASAYYTQPAIDYLRMKSLERLLPLVGEKISSNDYDVDVPICCKYADPVESTESEENRCVCMLAKRAPRNLKQFENVEAAGTEITYRCVNCRNCKTCLKGPINEEMSLESEAEQSLIEDCVNVDIEAGITMARLPFIADPDTHLVTNENIALRVFNTQVKILSIRPEDKKSVLNFEQALQDLGYVDYLSNLSESERDMIIQHEVKNFIPWRPVWKLDSTTTPCRLAFDASMSAKGGNSLNSILAKGSNSLNNLQGIAIRWMVHHHAFHTDIQKMYNKVWLHPSHWRYQLYLFSKDLNVGDIPIWKVIKTLIYGVRPSGGLAECGLRKTVELCKSQFPLAYNPIMYDTYMDDCASGTASAALSHHVIDEIECSLNKGGFTTKGITESGKDPLPQLSQDGKSICVLGFKWFPKGDFFKLNIAEINLSKKLRGRKRPEASGIIPSVLTLRHCVSRTAEVFDLVGRVAPILAGLKVDINALHMRSLGWDDPIPSELKEIWAANFNLIEEIGSIEFRRAVVPEDAVNLEVETLDMGDASENLACSAIYARFLRKDGTYSCQLIFSRTKIIHNMTIPRGELTAAVLNASTGHVVRTSLKDFHKSSVHVTDSQVALMWINSTKTVLKPFVRHRVGEAKRLTVSEKWYYTESENNIADLGTRRGVKIEQVGPDSEWINGKPWMRESVDAFPLKSAQDLVLSAKEKADLNKEKLLPDVDFTKEAMCAYTSVPDEVGDRYKFSNYVVNPCKFRYRTVLRIVGFVFLFIRKISVKRTERLKRTFSCLEPFPRDDSIDQYAVFSFSFSSSPSASKVVIVRLFKEVLSAAKNYFFRKATLEIQKFVDPKKYTNISVLKDGILYFTSRILVTQKIDGRPNFTDAVLDLSEATFCVPITDAHSPIAYAIVLQTHWHDPDIKHSGVESTLRYAQNTAHIIGGRELVKKVCNGCIRCRILHKQGVKIAMGPIADENLKVAPVFYFSQTDICGPYNAYSPANKRATLKIYFVVFCCTVTGAVDCRVMEDYTTDSFVLAFSRFSCRFGYPKLLMPDEGSQLVKGCQDMVLNFTDLAHKLSTEYGVDFKTCPVGAHYVHGKVERKIQQIKRSLNKTLDKSRLSVLQWETLGQQVSNSINNLPIGLGNKVESLESLDILTPNRLILGRNNSRGPVSPLSITGDCRKIVESNKSIYESWFKEWLVSYVPTLVRQPKWFKTDRNIRVGDIVLFTKSDKEFEKIYHYGIVITTFESKDGLIRVVEVQYQNHNENTKRTTKRCVRELIVVHPVDELGIQAELDEFAEQSE